MIKFVLSWIRQAWYNVIMISGHFMLQLHLVHLVNKFKIIIQIIIFGKIVKQNYKFELGFKQMIYQNISFLFIFMFIQRCQQNDKTYIYIQLICGSSIIINK